MSHFQEKIWKISEPQSGYCTSGPNPRLRAFVETHRKSYDPDDDEYCKGSKVLQKILSRGDAIFNMHTYHKGKKHYQAIMSYLE